MFSVDDFVRLIDDPQRMGIFRGSDVRAGRVYARVQFPSGVRSIPMDQIEALPDTSEEPIDFLRSMRLSEPARLRQVLAHIRLTGRLADVIYSMEATNTEFHAHQFKPVLKMLSSPTGSLLIADEVGLGKTIEAGLIWTELRARFDYRRLLVVCPKVLCSKWEAELTGKFGLDARVHSAADLLSLLNNEQRMEQGFVAICGLQGLRPPRRWGDEEDPQYERHSARLARYLSDHLEDEPLFDMLVVDEAHHLRNPETQSNTLAKMVQPLAQHVVFLSATPIQLRNRDLFSLLSLVDPQTFRHESVLDDILEANGPLVAAREATLRGRMISEIRERLAEAEQHTLLAGSQQIAALQQELRGLNDPLPVADRARLAARLDQVNLLANAVNRTRRRDVEELRVVRRVYPYAEEMQPIERETYDAITEVVQRHALGRDIPAGFLLATPQRLLASCIPAAVDHWRRQITEIDIEDEDDPDNENDDSSLALRPLVALLAEACMALPPPAELERHDSKFDKFLEVVRGFLGAEPDEKVVVFSTFRATLNYLARRLQEAGLGCSVIHGGTTDRDVSLSRFQADPDLNVLLSSEVGSEGIDLQFCRAIINYDLPWNPMRVEQRIGRIDRLGQAAETVTVINLMHAGTIDQLIYDRLYQRLQLCERALGGFEAVLGEAIAKLTPDLLKGGLTGEQIAERIEQTRQAVEVRFKIEEELEQEAASLIAHGDQVLRSIRTSHEMHRWIGARDLARYLADSLASIYPGSAVRDLDRDDLYEILLSSEGRRAFVGWLRDRRLPMGGRLERGEGPVVCRLGRPAPGRGAGRAIETVTQTHPLVRFVADRVADTEAPKLRPAVAGRLRASRQRMSSPLPPGTYVVLAMLWSFGGQVSQEKIAYAGMTLPDGEAIGDEAAEALMLSTAEDGGLWVDAEVTVDGPVIADMCETRLREELMHRFSLEEAERRAEQEDRAAIQLRTLQQRFAEQRDRLQAIINAQERRAASGTPEARRAGNAVRMNTAKLQRLKERTDARRDEITRGQRQTAEAEQLAVAIIEVTP